MKTQKNKFIWLPLIMLAVMFARFAPDAQAQILKPGEIIYSRAATVDGGNCDTASIWVVGQDGSNDRFITNGLHPRISPDGRFLLFKRFQQNALCSPFSITPIWWIRELATKRETQIASNLQPSSGHFFSPETNRGGHQIVKSDGAGICRMNTDGTNRVCSFIPSLDPIRGGGHPSVRGADNLLLVQNFLDNADGGLYTLNYDDLQNRQKIPNTIGRDLNPSWSNDGQKIAFAAFPTGRGEPYFFINLFTIQPDGSNRTQLTFLTQPFGEGFSYSLVWSPDNSVIYNAAKLNGVAGIYKISASGGGISGQIPITPGANPEWVGGIVPAYSEQQIAAFGGGAATGGDYTLVDTVGQAFAGQTSTGGNYNFQSGFFTQQISRTAFDYDGDGRTDLSVFRPDDGTWYVNRSTGGSVSAQWGISTDKPAPVDWDGDGRTDIAVWREAPAGQAAFYILNSQTNTFRLERFGAAGDIPNVVGDWDGDGRADVAVYRPSNSVFYYRGSLNNPNSSVSSVSWGVAGDVPVRGDFDGDGRIDAAVFRPSDRVWYALRSSDNQLQAQQFGLTTDKLAPADYDGDGRTDVAVFRPSEGNWYVSRSASGNFQALNWGAANDIPVPGDYDGDGQTDFAVYRSGIWYIRLATGSIIYGNWGVAGDVPTPSAFR